MPRFSGESKNQLATCDIRLQKLFNRVIEIFDCKVLQGMRTIEEQKRYVAEGKSKTMASKHLTTPSIAVDVAPFPIDWGTSGSLDKRTKAINRFYLFAGVVLGVASEMKIPIRWGGDWDRDTDLLDQTFNDLVHFELEE